MSSIRRDLVVRASCAAVWDAVRDVGQLHSRLLPGLVADTRVVPGGRFVALVNGMLVRECIVDIDDSGHRLVSGLYSGWSDFYVSSMQVFRLPHGRSRLLWIVDYCSEPGSGYVARAVDTAIAVMHATLEAELLADGQPSPAAEASNSWSAMKLRADSIARRPA